MLPADRLRDKLITMNNKGFQVYQDLAGAYRFDRFVLYLDSIQTDPVAAPTRARVRIDQAEAQVPQASWATPARYTAVADYLARRVQEAIRRHVRSRWSGRLAPLAIDAGGQAILARTACTVAEDYVEVRLAIGLPGEGRKVLAKAAQALFFEELPSVVDGGLVWANLDGDAGRRYVEAVEDYLALRDALAQHGLVAFVADGSVLPREAPPGDGPVRGRAVPLRAPDELAVTVTLPHRGPVRGLGIPRGVTVIAGGAFQGKSTLLHAIGAGVYPHMPGDGRELVATTPDAVTIRAETGRRIERVDVSAFIRDDPHRSDVTALSVEHAPGAVSMAAAVSEALEVGTGLLLFDEDDSAIAFLARDAAMQQLVPKARQPITPLVDHLRALWETHGVSSMIATGGLGDYLEVADTVIVMDGFQPVAATDRARSIVAARAERRTPEGTTVSPPVPRCPLPRGFAGFRGRRLWAEVRGRAVLGVGRETVDLAPLRQLSDPSQARAAGDMIVYAIEKGYVDGSNSIVQVLDRVFADIEASGLGVLASGEGHPGDHALPRRHEVAAVLNRMRALQARQRRAMPDAPREHAPPEEPAVLLAPAAAGPAQAGASEEEATESRPEDRSEGV